MRSASEAAQGPADALFEDFEVGRALSREGVLFHPSPQPLVGIQFGGVGWQTIHPQAGVVFGKGRPSLFRAVGIQPVPEQEDRARNPVQQVTDEGDDLGAGDGAPYQTQVGVRVRGDCRDGRQLRPVEAVIEKRRLASRRPSLAGRGQQREAALVEKDQRGLQDLGFFFKRGQVRFTQRWMAASSRSRARRAGFCQLQPKRGSRRQT